MRYHQQDSTEVFRVSYMANQGNRVIVVQLEIGDFLARRGRVPVEKDGFFRCLFGDGFYKRSQVGTFPLQFLHILVLLGSFGKRNQLLAELAFSRLYWLQ